MDNNNIEVMRRYYSLISKLGLNDFDVDYLTNGNLGNPEKIRNFLFQNRRPFSNFLQKLINLLGINNLVPKIGDIFGNDWRQDFIEDIKKYSSPGTNELQFINALESFLQDDNIQGDTVVVPLYNYQMKQFSTLNSNLNETEPYKPELDKALFLIYSSYYPVKNNNLNLLTIDVKKRISIILKENNISLDEIAELLEATSRTIRNYTD